MAEMTIEYLHASPYGNGASIAEEFKRLRAAKGAPSVNVHHIREARPRELMPADLYVFSSPGHRASAPAVGVSFELRLARASRAPGHQPLDRLRRPVYARRRRALQ